VQILAKKQNKSSYGQAQDANSTPEVNDKEVLSHSCHYIDDYFPNPNGENAHYVGTESVETRGKCRLV